MYDCYPSLYEINVYTHAGLLRASSWNREGHYHTSRVQQKRVVLALSPMGRSDAWKKRKKLERGGLLGDLAGSKSEQFRMG